MKQYSKWMYGCYVLLFSVIITTSCNRNSLELPVPEQKSYFDTTIGAGTNNSLKLRLWKTGYAGKNSLSVSVTNLGSTEYKNLRLMVEITNGKVGKESKSLLQQILTIAELKAGNTSDYLLLSPDTTLPVQGGHLYATLVGYDDAAQPYCGVYNYAGNNVAFISKGVVLYYGRVMGQVATDGTVKLRINGLNINKSVYELNGTLLDTIYSSGTITEYTSESTSFFVTDTFATGVRYIYDEASKLLTFNIKLATPITKDSIDHLLFNIRKN